MRRKPSALAAAALAVALGAAACGSGGGDSTKDHSSPGFAECDAKPNTCNTTATRPGGSLIVSIEKTIQNWNTADTDGNSYETGQVLSGVTPTPFYVAPDTSVQWNKDLLTAEPNVTSTSPLTVVYHLRPEAKWDDGTPISAKDFAYFWHSNNGRDCPECTSAGTPATT
jgi:peptide/nickel transport system substrate-binding protein